MLASQTLPRPALNQTDVREMFRIFCETFDGASPEIFERDLNDKNWIILLRDDRTGRLAGFSTLALYETQFMGQSISVVYSGDTVIGREYWGSPELPRSWIRTVLDKSADMPQPLYWLLISSGYKTYRYLTVFYKEFYPRFDRPTPPDTQALMNHLASVRFGSDFDCQKGIVRFNQGATPLRKGVAQVTDERLRDPNVAFYVSKNPGHVIGDELVCITQVHPGNFTPAGKRMVR